MDPSDRDRTDAWRLVLRRYFLVVAVGNLAWETAQLPLYTIWREGTARTMAVAVLHCTAGDLLIAAATPLLSLMILGHGWPMRTAAVCGVAAATTVAGVGYTVFSEWLNIVVRQSWAYSDLMPVIPGLGTGVSPVAQWIVIPAAGFWWARRANLGGRTAPGARNVPRA